MTKKFIRFVAVFLTLALTISNIVSLTYSFAQTNETQQTTTDKCKIDKVTDLHVTRRSSTCIKLQWCRVNNADGYRIYRTTAKNGIYKVTKEVSSNTSCYVDKDLKSGTNYYYKVRAYKVVGDKTYFGCCSDLLETTTCPEKVDYLHTSCVSNSSVELDWDKVCGASGYEVYRANTENGTYNRVATITDGKRTSYKDDNLRNNKKYYYKVRAFKELNGQICFGECSNVLGICTKK